MIRRLVFLIAAPLALAWLVSACGGVEKERLSGERLSVLSLERALKPDPEVAGLEIRLPPPYLNAEWPQNGGYPTHAMHHLAARDALAVAWEIEIGKGSRGAHRLLAPPVAAGGRLFTMDALSRVAAFDAQTGKRLWRVAVIPKSEEDSVFGGGVAFADGRLFVTTGFGEVISLEPEQGRVVWRASTGLPMRAAPAVAGGRVFAVTYDNQVFAFSAEDGRELWFHSGITETAGLLGGASPAVQSDIVIVPYSSGELFALTAANGRVVWSYALSFRNPAGGLAALNDIRGNPIIDRDVVYAISHGGGLVAIDLRTGSPIWEQDVAGVNTPWVAGDFLYVLTTEAQLLCLFKADGRIRWVQQLPRFEVPEKRSDPIFWSGPLLIGDRLIVVNTLGSVLAVSPYTGAILGKEEMPDPIRISPIAAQGTLYVLTDDAELFALR